ncbi:MAG: hypothetical protein A3B10_03430 [Candidatus Doudnabacteria bacterium RIFCSPLOWO2_01_FULL_44_21]|uniref:Type II secretion system protein GspG C-terminal domain-containing protein n=1 Tax=Candidatus Doudnabacteria bacterium RIFCSPLOWO2_01_FULL_44_21 TaxID=1817841 RepID=A0A1F5PY01_9BACT|nr:MAG: hypothetical protein A3B95_02420 [Candidatus Doudnabacteria bacterium RIFCSPHIGHO2_02_FULL_43_13b]OGE94818.1 MAG: hypothetical protein A3B10_03430 [Candidatus Doudnabacteria bacterium RIFCSPLOWO2_01_FULL_44_21]
MKKNGFTLIELLVVISIIGFMAVFAMVSLKSARDKTRAARMAADFSAMRNAWALWQSDTGSAFVYENTYGNTNSEATCHDEPVLSDTDLFTNVSGTNGWKGPYLGSAPRDPFGRQYSYDNDNDIWTFSNKWGGVNIQVQWCNSTEGNRYLQLAPEIDRIYDSGDGPDSGRFRWDNAASQGGYGIIVARSSTQ